MCINGTFAVPPPQDAKTSYQQANLALFLLYVIYVLVTIAFWRHVTKRYRPVALEQRSFVLMMVSGLGGIIEFVVVCIREYIGADGFSCDWYLWLNVFLVPLLLGPIGLQLAMFSFKADFNRDAGVLDPKMIKTMFQNFDLDTMKSRRRTTVVMFPKRGRRKTTAPPGKRAASVDDKKLAADKKSAIVSGEAVPQIEDIMQFTNAEQIIDAKHRSSDWHAARLVMLGMVIPVLIIGIAIFVSTADKYGEGCTGCVTSTTELGVFGFEVIILVGVGAWFGWKTRTLSDPHHILRNTRDVLIVAAICGSISIGLVTVDPFSLTSQHEFAWGWLVCLTIAIMHTMLCTANLWGTFRTVHPTAVRLELDTFRQKLLIPDFHQAFRAFVVSEFSTENLLFYDFATALLASNSVDAKEKQVLDFVFIDPNSPFELNLSDQERNAYMEADVKDFIKAVSDVRDAVTSLMWKDTLPRFLRTEAGRSAVEMV